MSFINPILLSGLGAVIVPIIIHLLLREKPKPVTIPTFAFIQRAVQQSRASCKLVNILLLCSRILVLACIGLALSRPVWLDSPFKESGKGKVAAVIILDNSFYSAHEIDGTPQLEMARAAARRHLEKMTLGSKVACFTTTNYASGLTLALDSVALSIDRVQTQTVAGDLRAAIQAAGELLKREAADDVKIIIAVTDFNTAMMRPEDGPIGAPAECDLRLIALPPRRDNAYIRRLDLQAAACRTANRPIKMTCAVGGGSLLQDARLTLHLEGRQIAAKNVRQIDRSGNAVVVFEPTRTESGIFSGEVRLQSMDGLALDNRWFFTLHVRDAGRILCIGNPGEEIQQRDVVTMALAPRGWYGRQRFHIEKGSHRFGLDHQLLHTYDVLFITGKCEFPTDFWVRLQRYVNDGGSLIIMPDKTTSLPALNGGAMPLLPGAVEFTGPLTDPVVLRDPGNTLLGTKLLTQVNGDLARQTFRQVYFCQAAAENGGSVEEILHFSNNTVAMALNTHGRGRCMFVGIPIHAAWSDFIANDAFAPTIHTIAAHMLGETTGVKDVACGTPVVITHPGRMVSDTQVRLPDRNGVVQINTADYTGREYIFPETERPGVFTVTFEGESKAFKFAANVHRTDRHYRFLPPSDPTVSADSRTGIYAVADDVVLTATSIRRNLPLAPVLLFAAFLFLILESYLGNRHLRQA